MSRFPFTHLFIIALAAMCFIAIPAHAADSCEFVFNAMTKVISVPHHIYIIETAAFIPGGSRTSETIDVDGVIYIQVQGKWRKSSITQQQMAEQQQENLKTNKGTCQFLRDEAVNGEMASVYKVQTENDDEKVSGQVWISKSKNLPLREDQDMDVGGGAEGKSHHQMRWEYSNVHAPANVESAPHR